MLMYLRATSCDRFRLGLLLIVHSESSSGLIESSFIGIKACRAPTDHAAAYGAIPSDR
jgi:hypothetical protein